MTFLKKVPVQVIMTDEEKRLQIRIWRMKQTCGWMFIILVNSFIVYWLTMFSNEYDMAVFSLWLTANNMSLAHRFFTAPVMRATMFVFVVVISKYGMCCDPCIACFPHIVP